MNEWHTARAMNIFFTPSNNEYCLSEFITAHESFFIGHLEEITPSPYVD